MITPGDLLLIAVAGMMGGIAAAYASPRGWLAATLVASLTALGSAVWILQTGMVWDWQPDFQVAGERIHLHLDGLSALFLALLSVLGGVGGLYASEYWADRRHPVSAPLGRVFWVHPRSASLASWRL